MGRRKTFRVGARNHAILRWLLWYMQINNFAAAVFLSAAIAIIWGGIAFGLAKAIGLT
jgi:hypothetical protein